MNEIGYCWKISLFNNWYCSFGLCWWSPLEALELRRSIKIERGLNPFISIIISLLCVKLEYYLIKGEKE